VRPYTPELRVRELELYRARYCGLCHALRKYGHAARYTLTYDLVFLGMLLAEPGERAEMRFVRCPGSFRKRRACGGGATERAAAYSVILAYHKLRDNVLDDGFIRSMPSRIGMLLLHFAYRRAVRGAAGFDAAARDLLTRLESLERSGAARLDECADCFGKLLASMGGDGVEARSRIFAQTLYHLGRWIYIIDARNDLAGDTLRGRYNALSAAVAGAADARIAATLDGSVNQIGAAAELLDESVYSDILRNIIYMGLPAAQDAVLNGAWRKTYRGRKV
jgi:hypothetical protein